MKKFILFVISVCPLTYTSFPSGTTPLMIASTDSDATSFFDIISTNTSLDLDAQNSIGQTALLYALEFDQPFYTAILLQMGADPDIENNAGDDAFDLASMQDNPDLSSILAYTP